MLRAELVPDDPTTIVFTDSGTKVTVTIPASALVYQRSLDMEGEHLTYMCTTSMYSYKTELQDLMNFTEINQNIYC